MCTCIFTHRILPYVPWGSHPKGRTGSMGLSLLFTWIIFHFEEQLLGDTAHAGRIAAALAVFFLCRLYIRLPSLERKCDRP